MVDYMSAKIAIKFNIPLFEQNEIPDIRATGFLHNSLGFIGIGLWPAALFHLIEKKKDNLEVSNLDRDIMKYLYLIFTLIFLLFNQFLFLFYLNILYISI